MTSLAYPHTPLNRTKNMRFSSALFTGKERDEETGYGYFGARYMDHELMTMWLSVDPLADKYSSISPYAYCAWNPVKLIDPDGRDVWSVDENGNIQKTGIDGGEMKQTINYANGNTATFSGKHYQSILTDLSKSVEKSPLSSSKGDVTKKRSMTKLFLSLADNTNVEWGLHKFKGGKYTISTLHERQLSADPETLGESMSDLITMIHSHPSAEPNTKAEWSSMGFLTKDGTYKTCWSVIRPSDYTVRKNYPEKVNYYIYMKKSQNLYQLGLGPNLYPEYKGRIINSINLPW